MRPPYNSERLVIKMRTGYIGMYHFVGLKSRFEMIHILSRALCRRVGNLGAFTEFPEYGLGYSEANDTYDSGSIAGNLG